MKEEEERSEVQGGRDEEKGKGEGRRGFRMRSDLRIMKEK